MSAAAGAVDAKAVTLWRETAPTMSAVWTFNKPSWLAIGGTCDEYRALPASDFAALVALARAASTLFDAIAHGDDVHRAWLKEAIDNHFAGKPVPTVAARAAAPGEVRDDKGGSDV